MVNTIFIIIGLAVLTLIGWMAQGFFFTNQIPLIFRILVGIVAVGGVSLLLIVIRDRVKQAKTEDFKGVDK
jgi:cyanate permease